MFSLYLTGQVPFKKVYLWSMVVDSKGQKMSKSRGNVINPIELVDKYGADAFRAALLFGVAPGSRVPLSEDRVRSMRNFANKIWNIGRLLKLMPEGKDQSTIGEVAKKLQEEFRTVEKNYHQHMQKLQLSLAFSGLYEFIWHRLADDYLENLKPELRRGNIKALTLVKGIWLSCLRWLHPFMPFVTEAVYQELTNSKVSLLVFKENEQKLSRS